MRESVLRNLAIRAAADSIFLRQARQNLRGTPPGTATALPTRRRVR